MHCNITLFRLCSEKFFRATCIIQLKFIQMLPALHRVVVATAAWFCEQKKISLPTNTTIRVDEVVFKLKGFWNI